MTRYVSPLPPPILIPTSIYISIQLFRFLFNKERGKDSQLQRQAVRHLEGSNHHPESTWWMQADLGAVHGGMFNDTWILAFEYA